MSDVWYLLLAGVAGGYGLKVGTGAFVFDQRRPGACPSGRGAVRTMRRGPMFEWWSSDVDCLA